MVGPRGRGFDQPIPIQQLHVVRRGARAETGDLCALGGGQFIPRRQRIQDGQTRWVRPGTDATGGVDAQRGISSPRDRRFTVLWHRVQGYSLTSKLFNEYCSTYA